MTLPISIDDVSYYNKSFIGDLVITSTIIYFFPHTQDESKQLRKAESFSALSEHFGFVGLGLSFIVEMMSKELGTTNNSLLHKNGLFRAFDSNEELQSRLDTYIKALKQRRRPEEFSSSLPKPVRISIEEINKIRATFRGKLLIETRYDKHDFEVGLKRRKLLLEVLREGKYLDRGNDA